MKPALRRRRAFTLPECLAAVVFVGIVLPVVMYGLSISVQTSSTARHKVEAAQLAQLKINEFLLDRDPSAFANSGDFSQYGDRWSDYHWQSTSDNSIGTVYRVTVTVSWLERSTTHSLDMTTLVYPPNTSTSTDSTATGGG